MAKYNYFAHKDQLVLVITGKILKVNFAGLKICYNSMP